MAKFKVGDKVKSTFQGGDERIGIIIKKSDSNPSRNCWWIAGLKPGTTHKDGLDSYCEDFLELVESKPSVELGQYRIIPGGSIWKVQTHTYEGNIFGCICVKDSEFYRQGEWFHSTAEEIDSLSVVCENPNIGSVLTPGALCGVDSMPTGNSDVNVCSYYVGGKEIKVNNYHNQIEEDLRKLSR